MTGRPLNTSVNVQGRPYWRCSRCGYYLPEHLFSSNSKRHNGLQGWCKECASKGNKAHALKMKIMRTERELVKMKARLTREHG